MSETKELKKNTPPVDQEELKRICDELFEKILDGNARAVIRQYRSLKTQQPLRHILESMMQDMKTGEDKGQVYHYILALENDKT